MSRSQFNQHGTLLGDRAVSADSGGYAQLEVWAQELGRVDRFGIRGHRQLRRWAHQVRCDAAGIESWSRLRRDRRSRRSNGKSDAIDAEAAARSVLAGDLNRGSQDRGWAGRDDTPAQDS